MSEQGSNNNRMVLLLILGLPVTMILAASWLWFFVERGDLDLVGAMGTHNSGSLVQPPRQLDDHALVDASNLDFKYADLEPRWTLLVANPGGECGQTCERSLYLTRQIHTAIGKEYSRIGRMYVGDSDLQATTMGVETLSDDSPSPAGLMDYLEKEQRGLRAITVQAGVYNSLFPEQRESSDTWYLVDPAGWVMMTYTHDISYKDVITDLKFLLKNSSG